MRNILAQRMQAATPLSAELRIARIFEAWNRILAKLWGEERAAFITIISFKDGVLKVSTSAPAAKQQLQLEQIKLINEVNRQLGAKAVIRLSVESEGF